MTGLDFDLDDRIDAGGLQSGTPHLSGSTYSTRVSFIDVVAKIRGNGRDDCLCKDRVDTAPAPASPSAPSGAFSYGEYDFMYR